MMSTSPRPPRLAHLEYKWVALSNTTLGGLMAAINATSLIIALPAIFRGINLDPLDPANFSLLLWVLMGYLLVTAVVVVTLGRVGDMFGRVRMYNLGFVVFTLASIGLSATWSTGAAGAVEIIVMRMVQAVGGALLMANSAAILTDAFPSHQRGLALGVNQIAFQAGSFLGLILGGVLAAVNWRWVFLLNVPVGVVGTIWAYLALRELGERHPAHIDWAGNVTFAAGLGLLLIGVTYGIAPYGNSAMGWGNPSVIGSIVAGLALLAAFIAIERRVAAPLFNLELFRIRAFSAGNLAGLLSAVGLGGLQFLLIMWLQGIWLPLHGYSFEDTPLWAGIYMLPLTVGFVVAGPVSGWLSDRYGARPFATGGMLLAALSFVLLMALPANFSLPRLRGGDPPERRGLRDVRLPQHGSHHEQRAARVPRRRLGDARDLPEHRHAALDRRLLHAHDRWALGERPWRHVPRSHRQPRLRRRRHVPVTSPGRRVPVRRLPRLQPAGDAARTEGSRGASPRRRQSAREHRLLPLTHRGSLPRRGGGGLDLLDRHLPRGGRRLLAARRALRA